MTDLTQHRTGVEGRWRPRFALAALVRLVAYGLPVVSGSSAAWLVSHELGASSHRVLATVTAGLLIGNVGFVSETRRAAFSAGEREFVLGFWDFAAFIANSFVFLMIGLAVAQLPFAWLGAATLVTAILLVLAGRALTVYPLSLAFARSRRAIPLAQQHVLWWGGLRGALALALALSLPPELPFAGQIRIATFGVVVFSVVLQGLTMLLLLRRVKQA